MTMPKKRILVVDDEPELMKLVTTRLEANGYAVSAVSNGADGVTRAAAERPDLILLDVMMPVMDGFSVLQRLRADERTRAVPVIMLTARSETHLIMKAQALGAEDYLIKPFRAEELLALIARYLAP